MSLPPLLLLYTSLVLESEAELLYVGMLRAFVAGGVSATPVLPPHHPTVVFAPPDSRLRLSAGSLTLSFTPILRAQVGFHGLNRGVFSQMVPVGHEAEFFGAFFVAIKACWAARAVALSPSPSPTPITLTLTTHPHPSPLILTHTHTLTPHPRPPILTHHPHPSPSALTLRPHPHPSPSPLTLTRDPPGVFLDRPAHLTSPYPTLPHPTLPYPTLPYPTLPHLTTFLTRQVSLWVGPLTSAFIPYLTLPNST